MQPNLENPMQLCRNLEETIIRLTEARAGAVADTHLLTTTGVYAHTPSESWEGPYLRLVFPTDLETGKRAKTYIGSKPEAIAAHKEKLLRTARWRQLQTNIRTISDALDGIERRLRELNSMALNALEHRPEACGVRELRAMAARSCTLSRPVPAVGG